ncbi:MAG: integration host factor subunit beta [Rhodobacterales bacterium]|nr:integration host factor subunit beta [Rhodobacterales bacterium]
MPQSRARGAVDAVFDELAMALEEGRRIEIRGFGTLRPRYYPEYTGRDPRTGEPVMVASKVLPAFRPARDLIRRQNGENG